MGGTFGVVIRHQELWSIGLKNEAIGLGICLVIGTTVFDSVVDCTQCEMLLSNLCAFKICDLHLYVLLFYRFAVRFCDVSI